MVGVASSKVNFETTDPLIVTLDAANMATIQLSIVTDNPIPALSLALTGTRMDGIPCRANVAPVWVDTMLAKGKKILPIDITGCNPSSDLKGNLVILGSTGDRNQRQVLIYKWTSHLSAIAIFGGFSIAALIVLTCVAIVRHHGYRFSDPLGAAKWDFSSSWASNITVAAAVFGSITQFVGFPDRPVHDTKTSYLTLAFLGIAFVTVAPFFYRTFSRVIVEKPKDSDVTLMIQGGVGGFLVASATTLSGVFMQIITQFFLVDEIGLVLPNAGILVWIMRALLIAVGIGVIVYSSNTILGTIAANAARSAPSAGKLSTFSATPVLPEIARTRKVALL